MTYTCTGPCIEFRSPTQRRIPRCCSPQTMWSTIRNVAKQMFDDFRSGFNQRGLCFSTWWNISGSSVPSPEIRLGIWFFTTDPTLGIRWDFLQNSFKKIVGDR